MENAIDSLNCFNSANFKSVADKMSILKIHWVRFLILICAVSISAYVGNQFLSMHIPDPIYPNECRKAQLSDYFSDLAGTAGDTDVYLFEGEQEGATALILGGTHANEPAGYITAVCLVENIDVEIGRLIILPRANNSGFTHNDPQEGNPQRFKIETQMVNVGFVMDQGIQTLLINGQTRMSMSITLPVKDCLEERREI